ncbi:MAG: HAD-IA family hydrolase [Dehalococcoidia bacterium]|nr:HAD-IA family hydrolase [Dehalococcoidia bacterium]
MVAGRTAGAVLLGVRGRRRRDLEAYRDRFAVRRLPGHGRRPLRRVPHVHRHRHRSRPLRHAGGVRVAARRVRHRRVVHARGGLREVPVGDARELPEAATGAGLRVSRRRPRCPRVPPDGGFVPGRVASRGAGVGDRRDDRAGPPQLPLPCSDRTAADGVTTPAPGPTQAVRAVFFDLGDTVWHFPRRPPPADVAREITRRVQGLLGEWGLASGIDAGGLHRRLGEGWDAAERAADADGGVGPHYPSLASEAARTAGLDLTAEQVERLWDAQNAGGRFLGRVVLPDAVATLEALCERGFRLGVITNRGHGGPPFLAELDDYGLGGFFETVVSSDQVGYRKPHPRIFQEALDRLGVRASEAAHVRDRLEADVAGARRAGLSAVWMRGVNASEREPDRADQQPHFVIDRLTDLLTLPILSSTAG